MFKAGDMVRHRNKPEWGLGRVAGTTGDGKVVVTFAARRGDVILTPDGAEKFLTLDTSPTTAILGPRAVSVAPAVAEARRVPCVACAADLLDVRESPDGAWRSCPSCSARSGRHHVFLPYPAAFAVVDVAATQDASAPPDARQGWCRACRAGGLATGFKTCSQVR